MRLVSQYGKYAIQYKSKRATTDINGVETITQEPVYLQFVQGEIFENERLQAQDVFGFKGQFQHQDEATPVDPLYRLSTFDTRAQDWTPELREQIEAWLVERDGEAGAYFIVHSTPVPAPFPAFDAWEGTPSALVEKLQEDGHNLDDVLTYERNFGRNRTPIVKALEKATEHEETVVVS